MVDTQFLESIEQPEFDKLIKIFKPLLPNLRIERGEGFSSYTDRGLIVLGGSILGGSMTLNYDLYCTAQHEISHNLFHSSTEAMHEFCENHHNRELAKLCLNAAEDVRIESLWNEVYITPFKQNTIEIIQVAEYRDPVIALLVHVMSGQKYPDKVPSVKYTDTEYNRIWNVINGCYDMVRKNAYFSSSLRAAQKLYDFFIQDIEASKAANESFMTGPQKWLDAERKQLRDKLSGSLGGMIDVRSSYIPMDDMPDAKDEKQEMANSKKFLTHVVGVLQKQAQQAAKDVDERSQIQATAITASSGTLGGYNSGGPLFNARRAVSIRRFHIRIPVRRKSTPELDVDGEDLDTEELVVERITGERQKKWWDEVYDTGFDITFLIDLSGSMLSVVSTVVEAVYNLWAAIERVPLVSVVAYAYSSGVNANCVIVKNKNILLHANPSGGTSSDEALLYTYKVLREGRKNLILHITDGNPNNAEQTRDVMQKLKRLGASIFTILIGTRKTHDVYGPPYGNFVALGRGNLYEVLSSRLFPEIMKHVKAFQ